MKLRPVSFHYKNDPSDTLQYGLVAEEVARVYPELVTRGTDGKLQSVRYLELNAMLLNELQKQDGELQKQAEELRKRAVESYQQAEQILSLSAQVRANEQKVAELQVNHERELRTPEASFEQRLSALEQTKPWGNGAPSHANAVVNYCRVNCDDGGLKRLVLVYSFSAIKGSLLLRATAV